MTDETVVGGDGEAEGEPIDRSLRDLLGDRPLEQPIELLVQLADEGEIDPWDLELIAVTDAFLDRIDDADLIVTARTLFYASVLLRMKSDEIVGSARQVEVEPPPEPFEEPAGDPVAVLEREMDRRLTRKTTRGTPATLADLIRDLRAAERERFLKPSRTYDTSGNGHLGPQTLDYRAIRNGEGANSAVASVTTTSHHEDLAGALEPLLERLEEAFEDRETVAFEEVSGAGPSPARTYRALVFLEHRGAVRLDQPAIYGPISIRPGPRALAAGRESRRDEDGQDRGR